MVKEFSDVFPEDLSGLPLVLEVGFSIHLIPETQPISIPHIVWHQHSRES